MLRAVAFCTRACVKFKSSGTVGVTLFTTISTIQFSGTYVFLHYRNKICSATVTLMISKLLLLDLCNSLASFAPTFIPKVNFWAVANVEYLSDSSHFCIVSLFSLS